MPNEPDLLAHVKPLADPVRVMTVLIVAGAVLLAMAKTAILMAAAATHMHGENPATVSSQTAATVHAANAMAVVSAIDAVAAVGVLFALCVGWTLIGWAILTGATGKPNAIFLRAFRTDQATAKLRAELAAALGPGFRLSGIRPPTKKTSMFLRFLAPSLVALRYAGSKFMELEAGDDWMARLWKTYQSTRLVFIDVRDVTVHVHLEIQMTLETMGIERCVFVVDSAKTGEQWRETIAAIAGPGEDRARLHLLDASPERIKGRKFHADLKAILAELPPGVPGASARGRKFILEHVTEEQLKMSQRTSPMVAICSGGGMLLSVGLGLVPFALLPIAVVTQVLVIRAIFRAIGRIRRLARAGHRSAAVNESFLLLIPASPFFMYALALSIAIPLMAGTRHEAQAAAAIASLRTINTAEQEYNLSYSGFTCQLSVLAGKPENGAPTADAADLIEGDLATGKHADYTYTFTSCTRTAFQGRETVTYYRIAATPDGGPGKGARGFCMDASGLILADPNGGTNCTVPVE
jgi:type IV pilus assembly protein PilA